MDFDSSDDRLLRVIVNVGDIDDNPPAFHKSVFTGGIATDVDFGTAFMAIGASDPDYGKNAVLKYSLDGEIVPALGSEGVEGIRKPPFLIDSETGDVILIRDPQCAHTGRVWGLWRQSPHT